MSTRFSSYESALAFLYGFRRTNLPTTPAAPTSQRLLGLLGINRTQHLTRIGHVTGTNGKGSTCAYLEKFLLSGGNRTIALTSPHNNSVRERIRLDGRAISKAMFTELIGEAAPALESLRGTSLHPRPTTIMSVLAMLLHEREGSTIYGIYEVGMGGGGDSTNVFSNAVVGLTAVGEDHLEAFGGSLKGVLLEKLALCRFAGVLAYQAQSESLNPVLEAYCEQRQVTLKPVVAMDITQANEALLELLLPGPWQAENAALAYQMLSLLDPATPSIQLLGIRAKTYRIVHPGRAEYRFIGERRLLLDGAHNEPAFERLLSYLASNVHTRIPVKSTAIVGFSTSKKWTNMVDGICRSGLFSTIVFTRSTRLSGVEPSKLVAYATVLQEDIQILQEENLRHALAWALERTSGVIVIFGSLHLLGDYDKALHALGLHQWAISEDEIDPQQPWMLPL
jgi:dihydrofolate synthase / folylpolyglutamate synthase